MCKVDEDEDFEYEARAAPTFTGTKDPREVRPTGSTWKLGDETLSIGLLKADGEETSLKL
jgi:hypothetical protein